MVKINTARTPHELVEDAENLIAMALMGEMKGSKQLRNILDSLTYIKLEMEGLNQYQIKSMLESKK